MKVKILILILAFMLIGCSNEESLKDDNINNDIIEDNNDSSSDELNNLNEDYDNQVLKFKSEYEYDNNNSDYETINISEESKINYLNDVYDFFTQETGIVYIGRPTCPYCRITLPNLLEAALEEDMFVHYVNSTDFKENDEYDSTLNLLSDYLRSDDEGNPLMYVPHVFFVKDGEIVGDYLGSTSKENYLDLINKLK